MKNLALWMVIFFVMYMLFHLLGTDAKKDTEMSYSSFISMVQRGQVKEVEIQGQKILGKDKKGGSFTTYAPEDESMVEILRKAGVTIIAKPASNPA